MAGWFNLSRWQINDSFPAPTVDIKIVWGGSKSGDNGYSFANGAWVLQNVTDNTYLFQEQISGTDSWEQVVTLEYGKTYLLAGKGRDSHMPDSFTFHGISVSGGGGGGSSYPGGHGFSKTIGPISPPDNIPPTISDPDLGGATIIQVNGVNYASDSSVTVSFTANDTGGSGLKGIHLSPGGFTTSNPASKTFTASSGLQTIAAYSEDNVGLKSAEKSYAFYFDTNPPVTTIAHNSAVTPEDGINYSNINPFVFDVTASDAESGVDSIEWSGTDGSSGQLSGDGTVEITTEGEEITVSVDAYDVAGNKSSTAATETVFIDTAEPDVSLALTNPEFTVDSKSYYATTSVDIDVEYDDVAGVKQADLYLNGSPISMPVTVPHTSTKNLTGVEGVNMAQLHVIDNATNEVYSSEVIFYVDETKPVCFINFSTQDTILENDGKYWTKENEIKVDLTYDDPGTDPSGIYMGEIVVNGSVPTSKSGFTLPLSGTSKTGHTVSGLSVGKNDIDFCVIDNAENISVKDTITVWVDQTATTGSMVRAEPIAALTDANVYTNTNKFDVDLTRGDSDAGFF